MEKEIVNFLQWLGSKGILPTKINLVVEEGSIVGKVEKILSAEEILDLYLDHLTCPGREEPEVPRERKPRYETPTPETVGVPVPETFPKVCPQEAGPTRKTFVKNILRQWDLAGRPCTRGQLSTAYSIPNDVIYKVYREMSRAGEISSEEPQ